MRELLQHEEGSSDAPARQRRPAIAKQCATLRCERLHLQCRRHQRRRRRRLRGDARQRLGRRPRGGVVVIVRQWPRAVAPPPDPRSHRQLGVVLIKTVASHQLHERAEGRGDAAARRRRQRHRHRQLRERVDAACILATLRVGDEDRRRRRVALGDGRRGEQGREAVRRRCSTRVGDGRRCDEPRVRPVVALVARCAAGGIA